MPFYHKLGDIPRLKHTTFFKEDGKSLYREELISSKGFSGIYSTKYHHSLPTALISQEELPLHKDVAWPEAPVQYYHFLTDQKQSHCDFIRSRNVFLRNDQCVIATAHPTEPSEEFFRNMYASEYIFVHHGKGMFTSEYGSFGFEEGDQIIVPRCTTYRLEFDSYDGNKLLIVESPTPFEIPPHFRNDRGQFNEDAPYCERDFKLPEQLDVVDEKGEIKVILKAGNRYFLQTSPHHPYDVVGWDGYLYPYAFNIRDYNPKVARLHLPPPVHLSFVTDHFVICNFVPRPFDFHEKAIPAPYFHSNIDSDEVLYYVEGDFMSRKGVSEGSITLHPAGMPHGPQPGKTEESVGTKETNEWAVMIDTFAPLMPTRNVKETMDMNYLQSWLDS